MEDKEEMVECILWMEDKRKDDGKFEGITNHILGKNGVMKMAIKGSIKYHSMDQFILTPFIIK